MVEILQQNTPYYVRSQHFDEDRMAGSVAVWKNNSSQDTQADTSSALSINKGNSSSKVVAPSLSFGELLDVVNPLQHLPVVGNVYRHMTGDTISPVAQIIGGTIYGGPLGGLTSIVSAAVEEHSGQDFGTAMVDQASVENRYKDAFNDEPRMAGSHSPSQVGQEELALVMPHLKPIQTAAIEPKSASPTPELDVFDRMNNEQMKAVTQVNIEVAQAKPRIRQEWNLNA